MSPEYAMFGQFSIKSDIFSFGVLILEIISGQKITRFRDEENIEYLLSYASMNTNWYYILWERRWWGVDFENQEKQKFDTIFSFDIDIFLQAWENWRDGTTSNLTDPTLRGGLIVEMMRCIHIGLLCVQQNVADSPNKTSVLLMLNSNSVALPAPTQPASFLRINLPSAESLQQGINSSVTKYEVSITELYPR